MVELQRTLRAAYDFMLANQRRQVRCSIVLPVRLRMVRSGATFECSSVNISSNGIAVSGSMRMKQFDSLDLEMVLPDKLVNTVVDTILKTAKTGKIGDGKIFLSRVEEAIRIRNEERGESAL